MLFTTIEVQLVYCSRQQLDSAALVNEGSTIGADCVENVFDVSVGVAPS